MLSRSIFAAATLGLLCLTAVAGCGSAGGQNENGENGSSTEDVTTTKVCPAHVVEGIDIYDGDGSVDWVTAKKAGIDFAFIKATQGTYNTQTSFQGHWSATKAAGVLRGAYHFFDPNDDGVEQANHFLDAIGDDLGDLPTVVDIECPNGTSTCLGGSHGSGKVAGATITKRLKDFLNTVEAATGRKPFLYTYASYFSDAGITTTGFQDYPLWIASLNSCASVPAPWKAPTIWQYSFTGKVSGIAHEVDRDRFVGTLDQLLAFADGNPGSNPSPTPGPTATSTVTSPAPTSTSTNPAPTSTGTPNPTPTTTGTTPNPTPTGTSTSPAPTSTGNPNPAPTGTGNPTPPPANGCEPITFPSGVTLVTVPNKTMTAEYAALNIDSCSLPTCFLDVTDLQDPSGASYDVHVKIGEHFELYELVATEVDPNGTGNVDPAHAYSTSVLVDPNLVADLDKARNDYGAPMDLTSGFRSPAHQKAVCESICGSDQCTDSSGAVTCARNSRHMWGSAADMSLSYEKACDEAGFPFVYHENGGTAVHLHVDMQACN